MIIIDWKRAAKDAVKFSIFCTVFVLQPLLMISGTNTLFGLDIKYALDISCASALLISGIFLTIRG